MSYGTRGAVRRKVSSEEDPNVIPRTAPLGFLGRLPFKIVGSLRYKPSAANLREHPGSGGTAQGYQGSAGQEEREPLLGSSEEEDAARRQKGSPRQRARSRSDTTTSGDTSSSYRSRGDLFPSDGEGDEDAVPLDDEFTVALERVDDQGSTRTHNSKGKRPADRDRNLSRTHSRTTLSSGNTPNDSRGSSNPVSPSRTMEEAMGFPSLEDLQREEEQAEREEHEELERRRQAAAQLAVQRGLSKDPSGRASEATGGIEGKDGSLDREAPLRPPEGQVPGASPGATGDAESGEVEVEEPKPRSAISPEPALSPTLKANGESRVQSTFVPARLPHFD
ncbi:uncharacterized protein THITE_2106916 [Thermothielavioides terrestris NRRL 8126]|uniref:Uncharacterized protein n=2 Tax=Thermothielavioides terrestris TaxID=2587410 RepID=G2QRZ4_THETT|nr:uncharacterized protein THITE_2106916 [Thermothielavioides terrestris NRRL 8126]AEO62581.1 hypothetical protein THITE_2106916 [Thermothielavioides terrestris NRRL 8126]